MSYSAGSGSVYPSVELTDQLVNLYGLGAINVQPNITIGQFGQLPPVIYAGGKERTVRATIKLAGQAAQSSFIIARLPLPCMITRFTLLTDTSLGTAQINLGNYSAAAIYMASRTFTATDTPTTVGKAGGIMQLLTTGYDGITGATTSATSPGSGGGAYTDIQLNVTSAAALPSSGTLYVLTHFIND